MALKIPVAGFELTHVISRELKKSPDSQMKL